MNIIQVYKQFPTKQDCIRYLEKVRWNNISVCPYCASKNQSPAPKEQRYHCNTCNTTFSVTVHTLFHKTKCDLQKWFLAITLTHDTKREISSRQLARDIEVSKDAAWFILHRIRKTSLDDPGLLNNILEANKVRVDDKNKHRRKYIKSKKANDVVRY